MNEELQSTNEELQALNDELRQRTSELDSTDNLMRDVGFVLKGAQARVTANVSGSQATGRPFS